MIRAFAVLVTAALAWVIPAQAGAAVLVPGHAPRVSARMRAFDWALTQQGKWYAWGETGPNGYDCSGLVMASYRHVGIILPRSTYEMLGQGVASGQLIRVSFQNAKKGDLAFYGTGHVELVVWVNRKHWTYGALEAGTRIGFHHYGYGWSPTALYRVRGAG